MIKQVKDLKVGDHVRDYGVLTRADKAFGRHSALYVIERQDSASDSPELWPGYALVSLVTGVVNTQEDLQIVDDFLYGIKSRLRVIIPHAENCPGRPGMRGICNCDATRLQPSVGARREKTKVSPTDADALIELASAIRVAGGQILIGLRARRSMAPMTGIINSLLGDVLPGGRPMAAFTFAALRANGGVHGLSGTVAVDTENGTMVPGTDFTIEHPPGCNTKRCPTTKAMRRYGNVADIIRDEETE